MHPTPDDPDVAEAARHAYRLTRLAYVGAGVAVAAVGMYAWRFFGPLSDQPGTWGQFGDYVGGILNPTFSFLALLALLATLGFQVRELRISTRELQNSARALAAQNETLRTQTFEATFFQILRLHNEIVAAHEIPERTLKGRACYKFYYGELLGRLRNEGATNLPDAAVTHYEVFYSQHQHALGHYFRLLYNLVKLIKRTERIDRQFYCNLIRAQMSSDELSLLFYNCLSSYGSVKFKPLVEEFALLKNFPTEHLPGPRLLRKYSQTAFGAAYPTET